jgi:hypothetical protein
MTPQGATSAKQNHNIKQHFEGLSPKPCKRTLQQGKTIISWSELYGRF